MIVNSLSIYIFIYIVFTIIKAFTKAYEKCKDKSGMISILRRERQVTYKSRIRDRKCYVS